MATCSAVENIIDTLNNTWVGNTAFHEEDVRKVAEAIAKNLCIEYQRFPKWD